ncbi:MAG: radical SAM family heme chaperone HemW [Bacteroidetes bacterium]|nr:radical SAM family heme chaperone HemW [Bacteroidota bacterium]
MSGIYIHIPFCKKACHYCNFHFSTIHSHKQRVVAAIIKEIELRKNYLPSNKIESIYFGGGTPSILTQVELNSIFNEIYKYFDVNEGAEITLEANPDDLNINRLKELKKSPINRLSIGIQSLRDEDLIWMNRAHSANEAKESIRNAKEFGFESLSIDLIYGTPNLSNDAWKSNILQAMDLGVNHISSYCLTVETKTALSHLIENGKLDPLSEEQAVQQFDILIDTLEKNSFEQYEISNFAKDGKYAIHNTNYWMNKPYIGIGPSAHSFNQTERSWNIANNILYAEAIEKNELPMETEVLSIANKLNEYVMTSLRTKWGCSLNYIESNFGYKYAEQILQQAYPHIQKNHLTKEGNTLLVSKAGKFFSDGIASDLFLL